MIISIHHNGREQSKREKKENAIITKIALN